MKRTGLALVAILLAGTFACARDDKPIERKLDEISQRLAAIESKMGNAPAPGAAAARPQQPQQVRARPNPTAVYAVPVANSAAVGSKLAKVTIVEAFTFT